MEKGRTLEEKTILVRFRWVLLVSLIVVLVFDVIVEVLGNSILSLRVLMGSIHNYALGAYGLLVGFSSVAALVRGRMFWLLRLRGRGGEQGQNRLRAVQLRSIYLSTICNPLIV